MPRPTRYFFVASALLWPKIRLYCLVARGSQFPWIITFLSGFCLNHSRFALRVFLRIGSDNGFVEIEIDWPESSCWRRRRRRRRRRNRSGNRNRSGSGRPSNHFFLLRRRSSFSPHGLLETSTAGEGKSKGYNKEQETKRFRFHLCTLL